MAAIDALIFDAEGVVVDTEKLWDVAQAELLGRRGLRYDRAAVKPLLAGRAALEGIRELQRVLALPGDPSELAAERLELVRATFADADFVPGFPALFTAVDGRFETCLATAMDPVLFHLIDARLGLSSLFHGRVVTLPDVSNRGKPAPDLFLHAASMVGQEPPACVVIEDAPSGIEAAHRAGMRCIGLTTTFDADMLADADVVVDSFSEVEAVLRTLAG